MSKPIVLFILGGPASGKGTLCAQLVKDYGYTHFSAGDILRNVVKNKSHPKWEELQNKMNAGMFVSSKELVGFIKAEFKPYGGKKILLDGFPRNEENIKEWNEQMKDECEEQGVLLLDCSVETMKKRMLGRNEGRADDKEEILVKRIEGFVKETVPCLKCYEDSGKLIKVNAEGSKEEVLDAVKKVFKEKGL